MVNDELISNIDKIVLMSDVKIAVSLYKIFNKKYVGYLPLIISSIYKMGFILGQRKEREKKQCVNAVRD